MLTHPGRVSVFMENQPNNPVVDAILAAGGEMLEQPLTNPDGSINPLCVGELMEAIDRAPSSLAGNSEWTVRRWTNRSDIVGAFAMWACRQSPYGVPDNLESVCKYLHASLKTEVAWDSNKMAELSLSGIEDMLRDILMDGCSEFQAWNERKNKRDGHGFVSRISGPSHPDDDFIDLHALLRNTCVTIRNERREFDALNVKF